jgi:hypothetical protein
VGLRCATAYAVTGASIIFTGITLAIIGVATCVPPPLKFQADIGIALTFMFPEHAGGDQLCCRRWPRLIRAGPRFPERPQAR